MHRHLMLCAALLLLGVRGTGAQEIPEFNKLRTPTSPAFVVLGTTPADVQRPNTPSTFAFSLLQGVGNSATGGGDFGVEVAPYWLVSHPGLTLSEYYDGGWLDNLARTATISFATLGAEDASAPSGKSRDMGLGVRARLLDRTRPSTQCAVQMDSIGVDLQRAVTFTTVTGTRPEVLSLPEAQRKDRVEELFGEFIRDSLTEPQRKRLKADVQACVNELSAREGFQMDIASAAAWRFPNQEPDDASLRSGAVWLTPSLTGRSFSWVGVARYRWNRDEDAENLVDLGARAIYAWSDYGLSMELVGRRPTNGGDDHYRVSLIGDIKLNEQLWLTTSFGRDFTRQDSDALFALANLQWNVGKRSISPDVPGLN
jgi:hypothetical protein